MSRKEPEDVTFRVVREYEERPGPSKIDREIKEHRLCPDCFKEFDYIEDNIELQGHQGEILKKSATGRPPKRCPECAEKKIRKDSRKPKRKERKELKQLDRSDCEDFAKCFKELRNEYKTADEMQEKLCLDCGEYVSVHKN